jgi:xanthine dehydrogenase YagS FAD-binding subunit
MRSFEYTSTRSATAALDLLGHDGHVRPLAGGTDLLPLLKADVQAPERLVDIKRVPELGGGIQAGPDGLHIGALTSLAAIEAHPAITSQYAALAEAVASAATPQLRNMATLGGNLLQRPRCWYFRSQHFHCWLKGGDDCQARDGENQFHAVVGSSPCVAVHPSDAPAALLAFDAQLRIAGRAGPRQLRLADFFVEPTADRRLEHTLGADELVVSVHLPSPPDGTRSTYLKAMNRNVWAFALVGVAAVVRLEGQRIAAARLVLNGVAPIPWRVPSAEDVLIGAEPTPAVFDRAAEAALSAAHPLSHNGYKLPLAKGLIVQALESVTA